MHPSTLPDHSGTEVQGTKFCHKASKASLAPTALGDLSDWNKYTSYPQYIISMQCPCPGLSVNTGSALTT